MKKTHEKKLILFLGKALYNEKTFWEKRMEINYKETGFRFIGDDMLEFWCDADRYEDLEKGEDVYVSGSFNGWTNTADSSWKMKRKVSRNSVYFELQKPAREVMVPGNTGYPEFRFYGLSPETSHFLTEKQICDEFSFEKNKLILQSKDEISDIADAKSAFEAEKKLSDFDPECPACRAEISNVRLVPGTKSLYRGYNPFKRSRGELDTEDLRIALVQKAFEVFGIKSDITLNGYEGANVLFGESVPEVIKEIEKENNRLCINIDYNLVYFHSDAFDFSDALRKIGLFMIEHPAPFYIHCRLGSDRTGVISAVFAALCGASWDDIARDYEKTSNMGIGEYRNRRLLQYSLEKMIGKNPAHCKDLAYNIQAFFLKESVFTMEEMKKIVEKLNSENAGSDSGFFDFSGKHICALRKSANA